MKLPLKRTNVDWSKIEEQLGIVVNDNYKEFYETLGAIELDEFLYIVGLNNEYGLIVQSKNTLNAYGDLKEFLDEELAIMTEWLPVGYTIDATFIFCNEDSVMLTDSGFETQEIFKMSLLEFITSIFENKITSKNLVEDITEIEHTIRILDKEQHPLS